MAIITITKCDLCGEELRSDTQTNWQSGMGNNIVLDLKTIPAIQSRYEWAHICRSCGYELKKGIDLALKKIKTKNVLYGESNGKKTST